MVMALMLWDLGYPDQALARIHDVLNLAHELAHPFTLAVVLTHTFRLHQYRREVQAAKGRGETLITLASDQGFPAWLMRGKMFQGWTLAMQGQAEDGIAQMRQCLASRQQDVMDNVAVMHMLMLAEAYGTGGLAEEGLIVLAEVLARIDRTRMRRREAELYWLKGELLLKQSAPNEQPAEACFHQALDIARRQHAKSWELRAATSLARLWQAQAKRQDASALLAPVYGWFTEGFDTADLQEAKALLDALK
jgi:predicted ATPase